MGQQGKRLIDLMEILQVGRRQVWPPDPPEPS